MVEVDVNGETGVTVKELDNFVEGCKTAMPEPAVDDPKMASMVTGFSCEQSSVVQTLV